MRRKFSVWFNLPDACQRLSLSPLRGPYAPFFATHRELYQISISQLKTYKSRSFLLSLPFTFLTLSRLDVHYFIPFHSRSAHFSFRCPIYTIRQSDIVNLMVPQDLIVHSPEVDIVQSDGVLGAVEISTFLGLVLYGVSLSQGYAYFRRNGEDRRALKALVRLCNILWLECSSTNECA